MVLRKLFRVLAVVGALVFTLYEGAVAVREYRDWDSAMKIGDRSGAELFGLNFKIDCGEILVAWAFAGGLIYVLRPKPVKP